MGSPLALESIFDIHIIHGVERAQVIIQWWRIRQAPSLGLNDSTSVVQLAMTTTNIFNYVPHSINIPDIHLDPKFPHILHKLFGAKSFRLRPLKAHHVQFRNPDAASTVQKHIALLHTYNEMRDIGTGLMGIIADNRGVRVRDVYRDFGVGESD